MSAATKDEVLNGQPVTGEVAVYGSPAMEEYRPRIVMAPQEAKALDDQLRACMLAVLREGTDYGPIPGGDKDKKNLLKPGAEKLLQWFGFGSRSIEVKTERDDPEHPSGIADKAQRIGITYRTEVTKTLADGREVIVATCEGYAGYDEDRYYKTAEESQAKAKAKEEHWARIDHREPNPRKWQGTGEDYRAPWNTVVKMSQKRSYVGAAIDATSAAGLFTQDMEDISAAAEAVPQASAVSEAGMAAIMGLPVETRKALDRWCREQGWPARSDWDAGQWCAALIQAGRFTVAPEPPQVQDTTPPATAQPATDTPADWTETAVARASGVPDSAAGRALYQETVAKRNAGEITAEQKNRVCAIITARIEQLSAGAGAVDGVIVPPPAGDDPWALKIEEITSAEDARSVLEELDKAHRGGVVDSRRANALRQAIRTKAASAGRQEVAT